MTDDRYIVVEVAYEKQLDYGRSLGWLAPELKDAGLIMTEDHTNEPRPSRTWAGIVDGPTFERFTHAFGLANELGEPTFRLLTEPGQIFARTYTLEGMNWEAAAGESPIVYVSVSVGDLPHVYQCQANRLASTYVG